MRIDQIANHFDAIGYTLLGFVNVGVGMLPNVLCDLKSITLEAIDIFYNSLTSFE